MYKTLQLTPEDNVAVVIKSDKPMLVGQKVALKQISINKPIIKYACVIGFAKRTIDKDEVVDHRNIVDSEETGKQPIRNEKFLFSSEESRHFLGYKNSDGSVDTELPVYYVICTMCIGILEYVVDSINKNDLNIKTSMVSLRSIILMDVEWRLMQLDQKFQNERFQTYWPIQILAIRQSS